MKIQFLLIAFVSLSWMKGSSQVTLQMEWKRMFGGSATECAGTSLLNNQGMAAASVVAADGNSYVLANTNSSNGLVTQNWGGDDIWLIKLNTFGDTVWTKVIGGSGFERAYKIKQLTGGDLILVGQSQSLDGDFVGNNVTGGGFLIRISTDGVVLWKQTYGGSAQDYLYDVIENPTNGTLVACGESLSNDGDLTNTGSGLCWAIWVNANTGATIQSKTYSSPYSTIADYLDNFTLVTRLSDNSGYIFSGFATPNFNDPASDDIFILKTDLQGNQLWSKLVGSTNGGDGSSAILDAGQGQFYIAGRLSGNAGTVPPFLGGVSDAWLLKFQANGNLLWSKNYGGSNWEFFADATQDGNGHLWFAGFTRSTDQLLDTTTARGLSDFWLVATDTTGTILYQGRWGGSANDFLLGISVESNGKITACGRTDSNDGDCIGSWGSRDVWVARFSSLLPTALGHIQSQYHWTYYPNPVTEFLEVWATKPIQRIRIVSLAGQELWRGNDKRISLSTFPPGVYLLEVWLEGNEFPETKKLIRN